MEKNYITDIHLMQELLMENDIKFYKSKVRYWKQRKEESDPKIKILCRICENMIVYENYMVISI